MPLTLPSVSSGVGQIPTSWRLARAIIGGTLLSVLDNRFARIVAEINNISATAGAVQIGMVIPWSGSSGSVPSNYLICDGTVYNIVDYPDLGALLGSTYGGNGTTTFGVPDLRGRVVAGQDDMGGTSANRVTDASADSLGGVLGSEDHTLTISEMPSHDHTGNYSNIDVAGAVDTVGHHPSGANISSSVVAEGGGGAHNNIQPTLFINYIVRAT